MTKTLVLYSLRCQKSENRFLYNLKYFIDNGGIIDNKNIDYLIIVNSDEKPKIDLPKKVKLLLKPNFGHGWGGWYEGLETVNKDNYKYFCFINDTIIGPFINNLMSRNWINLLKSFISDSTKLVTNNIKVLFKDKNLVVKINTDFMFFSREVLDLFVIKKFFSGNYPYRKIHRKLTNILLNKNINIASIDQLTVNNYLNLINYNNNDEIKKNNILSMVFLNLKNEKNFNNFKNDNIFINNLKNLNIDKKINTIAKQCFQKYNIYPISFSFFNDELPKIKKKEKKYGHCIPGDRKTYIFNNQTDYFNDYQNSIFGLTKKKKGWDCNRHLEIMFNNCIPIFENINKCPKYTMIHYPKEMLNEILKNKERIMNNINLQHICINLLRDHFIKNLTNESIINYIFDITKNKIENINRILFIDSSLAFIRDDYLSVMILNGLKLKFKNKVDVVFPYYKNYKDEKINYNNGYGKGFSFTNLLEQNWKSEIEKNPIIIKKDTKSIGGKKIEIDSKKLKSLEEYIFTKNYDFIFYGNIRRCVFLYDKLNEIYKNKIFIIDGEDSIRINKKYKGSNYFKREIYFK